jgi:hypothetical protein
LPKIENIAIVDDKRENLVAAALAVIMTMPGTKIRTYLSGGEFVSALKAGGVDADLVVSDMNMEEKDSGYHLAVEAWAWNIPTTIVTGGHKTHTTDQVKLGYPRFEIHGEKDDPEVWKKILEVIFQEDATSNGLMTALLIGRKKSPDWAYGKTCAAVTVPL